MPSIRTWSTTTASPASIQRQALRASLPRGTTHLLSALGQELIRQGRRVAFTTCVRLVRDLLRTKSELRFEQRHQKARLLWDRRSGRFWDSSSACIGKTAPDIVAQPFTRIRDTGRIEQFRDPVVGSALAG
jgi:hypothetical protein